MISIPFLSVVSTGEVAEIQLQTTSNSIEIRLEGNIEAKVIQGQFSFAIQANQWETVGLLGLGIKTIILQVKSPALLTALYLRKQNGSTNSFFGALDISPFDGLQLLQAEGNAFDAVTFNETALNTAGNQFYLQNNSLDIPALLTALQAITTNAGGRIIVGFGNQNISPAIASNVATLENLGLAIGIAHFEYQTSNLT